jgi:hypothetical protein
LKKAASWKQKVSNDRERIGALIDVYLDTIHPVFPLYCERELWVGWRESTFPANSSEYASLIAMCALSAQHAQQGSLFEADEPLANFAASTQPYLDDAMHLVMGQQQPDILDLEYVRACGFLALFGIQTGNLSMIHKYLGMYHGVCARFSLHDEAQWDDMFEISVCELEMRRRLYWAMYKLEVHSACVLGHMIRLPEDHTSVTPQRQSTGEFSLHQRLLEIQSRALPQFDQVHDKSTDSGRNRCGFQATNILFTIHMVQMFLATGSPARMLEAAKTLLDSAKRIPADYIRAGGVLLLQEMAGFGLMLGAIAAQSSTPFAEAESLVNIEAALAEFLESRSAASGTAKALASRLREQIKQVNIHLISTNHAEDTNDSNERLPYTAWDEDIYELSSFEQFSCETGILPMHFQPRFLMDYTPTPD